MQFSSWISENGSHINCDKIESYSFGNVFMGYNYHYVTDCCYCYNNPFLLLPLLLLSSLLSLFWKNKSTLMISPCCLYFCYVYPLTNFQCLNQSSWNWVRISCHLRTFNGALNKSLPSVTQTKQPLKLNGFIEVITHTD
jgi:hypothetical protein